MGTFVFLLIVFIMTGVIWIATSITGLMVGFFKKLVGGAFLLSGVFMVIAMFGLSGSQTVY